MKITTACEIHLHKLCDGTGNEEHDSTLPEIPFQCECPCHGGRKVEDDET